MPRQKKSETGFQIKELNVNEAQREFNRRRGRGSKYDAILDAAEKLEEGKALIIEQITYSEVNGIRSRIRDMLKGDYQVESTKVNAEKGLYDVLIHRG